MTSIYLPEPINFEWDEGNEEKNWLKHKVDIKECEQAFTDPFRQLWKDVPHSTENEPRYILLGSTEVKRILFVVFTTRKSNIRVISARDASRKERKIYL